MSYSSLSRWIEKKKKTGRQSVLTPDMMVSLEPLFPKWTLGQIRATLDKILLVCQSIPTNTNYSVEMFNARVSGDSRNESVELTRRILEHVVNMGILHKDELGDQYYVQDR